MQLPTLDIEKGTELPSEVNISWKNIVVRTGNKVILNNLQGAIEGKLLAILGATGSGKTTFLNVLARRLTRGLKLEGEVRMNGKVVTTTALKRLSGYVMQEDLLFPNLSVEETLQFAAALRLPRNTTKEDKQKRVDEVIQRLGLERCRGTIVGDVTQRRLSGGERKRLCIGIELLARPKILFLDEPTSGLDSATAYSLVKILKGLSEEGTSIICTVHQPQSKIFKLFQNAMIVHRGEILYHGPTEDILKHYEKAGLPCPELMNPADHVLDVISTAHPEEMEDNFQRLKSLYKPPEIHFKDTEGDLDDIVTDEKPTWIHQFLVLVHRTFNEARRDKKMIILQLVQNFIMALLIGFVFYQIGNTQTSVIRRQPVLFFCCINQGIFGALVLINSFPQERALILRERAAGSYRVSAYFLAKSLVEIVFQSMYPIVFCIVVYWLVGFQQEAGKFFLFLFFILLCCNSATSMALAVSTLCRTTTLSVNVLPTILELVRLYGGFFLSPKNLPKYFAWLDSLSYIKYAYVGISLNELTDLTLVCTDDQLKNGVCPVTSGEQKIEEFGFDQFNIGTCIGALIALIVAFRLIAFAGLKWIKW